MIFAADGVFFASRADEIVPAVDLGRRGSDSVGVGICEEPLLALDEVIKQSCCEVMGDTLVVAVGEVESTPSGWRFCSAECGGEQKLTDSDKLSFLTGRPDTSAAEPASLPVDKQQLLSFKLGDLVISQCTARC